MCTTLKSEILKKCKLLGPLNPNPDLPWVMKNKITTFTLLADFEDRSEKGNNTEENVFEEVLLDGAF